MDDLKLYGKDEAQIDSLVKSVYTFSTDIGMEFGLTKCGVIILKRGKVVKLGGIVLPTGEVMKTIDDEGYKYLGILELDEIMEKRMKDKFMNEYYRRLRLVLKSKLNGRNKFQAITICKQPFGANFFTRCFTPKTYTFGRRNVYVWQAKRVRLAGETCTFGRRNMHSYTCKLISLDR